MTHGTNRTTLLLGAGFSQALGVPGTDRITALVDSKLAQVGGSVYDDMCKRVSTRFKRRTFEEMAAALEFCSTYECPGFLEETAYFSIAPIVAELRHGLTAELVHSMYEHLMATVVDAVQDQINTLNADNAERNIRHFFGRISQRGEHIDVATLNYDEKTDLLLPNAFDGFIGNDEQQFRARDFLDCTGDRIGHLHGHIWFGFRNGSTSIIKIPNMPRPSRYALWARRYDGSFYHAIVSGNDKSAKLSLPPYNVYFQWLSNALLGSPRLIVAGYSFSDPHLNIWINEAAAFHGKQFRLAILDQFEVSHIPPMISAMMGIANGLEAQNDIDGLAASLKFDDGIAEHNSALLLQTGFPPTETQSESIAAFLKS